MLESVQLADLQGRRVGEDDVVVVTLAGVLDENPLVPELIGILHPSEHHPAAASVGEVGGTVAVSERATRSDVTLLGDIRETALGEFIEIDVRLTHSRASGQSQSGEGGHARPQEHGETLFDPHNYHYTQLVLVCQVYVHAYIRITIDTC